MKTGLHDRLRGSQRDRVAPDTGPMTGSINYQQPSTIRGKPTVAKWCLGSIADSVSHGDDARASGAALDSESRALLRCG